MVREYSPMKMSNFEERPKMSLEKASEFMRPEDFSYFKNHIEARGNEGFDMHGKVLHTTNSYYFENILKQGIRTEGGKDGLYGSAGASFTNGDFEEALTFQTLIDDQNSRSNEKRFNTEQYADKATSFVKYFWDKDAAAMQQYLQKISGKEIHSLEEAVAAAKTFQYTATPTGIKDNPEALAKLFGITVVFDKEKLPELTAEGTAGLQQDFELRSYRPDGIPLAEASAVFVPETQVVAMQQKLQEHGLAHVTVLPSEELEVMRMQKILESQ